MIKQNLDWENMDFKYVKTHKRYVSNWKDGAWDDGALTEDATVTISESAGVLQYAQTVFEGLKAYETVDGRVVCFRPNLNADRLEASALRLVMPPFPKDRFLEAVREVVLANLDFIPPRDSGATLYLRPFLFGSDAVIGVRPAKEYQFRLFATPVGPYYKGAAKPLCLTISDYDRAAPHGTGNIKAGLNYAMSLLSNVTSHRAGYDESLYLDAATRTYIEETGGANIIFIKGNKFITPNSRSILPSITRLSLEHVAKHYLDMEVEERPITLSEIPSFDEAGLCGTAAVLSPVGKVVDHGKEYALPTGMENAGPVISKLYDTLVGIQLGKVEAPKGWIFEIK